MNERQPFCWWMTSWLRCPSPPSPHPLFGWPCDFWGGKGVWVISGVRIFSPDIQQCKISVSALYTAWAIFLQCRILFFPVISLQAFSPQNPSAGYFFLKSPITPSKVKWSAPKIHQTFGQLTDSDLSIISKGFWNNRRLNSQGRGEEFVSTYPYLESPYGRTYGRKYGDVITKFSRMDSLPNIITHGASLRVLPARRLRYKI